MYLKITAGKDDEVEQVASNAEGLENGEEGEEESGDVEMVDRRRSIVSRLHSMKLDKATV